MKRVLEIVVLLSLFLPNTIQSQAEASNWYFGEEAGITFNADGSVTPLTDGKLDTEEGCTTISDSFGNLLFYTDGSVVYDKNHSVMPNGTDLDGNSSSTQSALIVPKPKDPDIYYIFTVDVRPNGLNYTIVDMSLNNGLGEVTQKNIRLLDRCTEKVTAVIKDCSEGSIWVMAFASIEGKDNPFSNTFHAFEVNVNGVMQQSVRSTFIDISILDERGYLKISPDGTKLVCANFLNGLYVYDFDTTTGTVSNQEEIVIAAEARYAYGVEFSPNSQYLYVNGVGEKITNANPNMPYISSLLQYDMLAPNIKNSLEILYSNSDSRGALQLGPNGKIYRTSPKTSTIGSPFLSVINDPNKKGNAANYTHNAIPLAGRDATQGLPPFIQSFFDTEDLIVNEDSSKSSFLKVCESESFTLELEAVPDGIYTWEKDGVILPNTTNTLHVQLASVGDTGKYKLTITIPNLTNCTIIGEGEIEIIPFGTASPLSLEQCDIDSNISDGITTFNLTQVIQDPNINYTFYASAQDQVNRIAISNPENFTTSKALSQTIFYSTTNRLGCEDLGELTLLVKPNVFALSPESPISTCTNNTQNGLLEGIFDLDAIRRNLYNGLDVTFYNNLSDASLEEHPLDQNLTSSDTTIYARVESNNQCQTVEIIDLIVQPLPNLILEDIHYLCTDGDLLLIDAPSGFDTYTWSRVNAQTIEQISNSNQILISDVGNYTLEVGVNHQNGGETITCSTSVNFEVLLSNKAIFQEININDLSDLNSIEVLVSGDGDYEYSLDGFSYSDTSFFENVPAGLYTVFVRDKNGCGISEEEIAVVGFPKFFTPNGDGTNDYWQIIGGSTDLVSGSITIYDRYGKLIKQMTPNDNGWDGTLNGKLLPSSDYWFSANLMNKKQLRGHFTLKR